MMRASKPLALTGSIAMYRALGGCIPDLQNSAEGIDHAISCAVCVIEGNGLARLDSIIT